MPKILVKECRNCSEQMDLSNNRWVENHQKLKAPTVDRLKKRLAVASLIGNKGELIKQARCLAQFRKQLEPF